jgi:hypothetical protein
MRQPKLVYPIKGIFTDCLTDYDAPGGYLIETYQRGYKWGSGKGEPVDKLLQDLWQSFRMGQESGNVREYYLQYITVKRIQRTDRPAVLEVIDGQQRLTTLSLLCSVLRYLQSSAKPSFTDDKLDYAIRSNFLRDFIYGDHCAHLLTQANWLDFIAVHPDCDRQDVWYLFSAAHALHTFLAKQTTDNLAAFESYLARHVMLIVNAIEEGVTSEKVFRNLNSNRVLLVESELVKGLLLTYAGRESPLDHASARSFHEILELRATLGRRWDEMERWVARENVSAFYSRAGSGPLLLLRLVADHQGYQPAGAPNERFPLLSFFQQRIQEGQFTAGAVLEELWLCHALLREWFEEDYMHNCLGLLFFSQEYQENRQVLLSQLTSRTVLESGPRRFLQSKIKNLPCLKSEATELAYSEHRSKIHDLLLLVNAFPKAARRFDFSSFGAGQWSLEHIFPQNPRRKGAPLEPVDQALLYELIPEEQRDEELLTLLAQPELSKDEQEKLKEKIRIAAPLLHRVGNMALLQSGDNSAMGNGFFDKKRQRIVDRISSGSFVPAHTFNVFSKLIIPTSASLNMWSKNDINTHADYIETERLRISELFS